MLTWTALSSVVQYLAVGKLPPDLSLWFGAIGAIGGATGQSVVRRIIVRTGRPSVVVFILGGVIGLAVALMAAQGSASVVHTLLSGGDLWAVDLGFLECDSLH